MKTLTDFGQLIRSSRLAQGQTQRELAKLAGTSQSYIDKIEHNQVDPRLSTILRLLRALGLEPGALNTTEREIVLQLAGSAGKTEDLLIPEES
jgi:transcriptional regulator with XRE-family HTH domain